ncbi:hypothetical protein HGRIS_009036 [Hohenbuehelia grisea]|uniref:Mid2 domain-containing protein n=1 Tax=Hohenbuehelia grisea TaxID=104357 RepID=A0ABR3J087_9AGAR
MRNHFRNRLLVGVPSTRRRLQRSGHGDTDGHPPGGSGSASGDRDDDKKDNRNGRHSGASDRPRQHNGGHGDTIVIVSSDSDLTSVVSSLQAPASPTDEATNTSSQGFVNPSSSETSHSQQSKDALPTISTIVFPSSRVSSATLSLAVTSSIPIISIEPSSSTSHSITSQYATNTSLVSSINKTPAGGSNSEAAIVEGVLGGALGLLVLLLGVGAFVYLRKSPTDRRVTPFTACFNSLWHPSSKATPQLPIHRSRERDQSGVGQEDDGAAQRTLSDESLPSYNSRA